jgi:flagellar protein FlaI
MVDDSNLEDIMVNGISLPVMVFHRKYGMCTTNIIFRKMAQLSSMIRRLCRVHNVQHEMIVDFSSFDGNRINITTDPLSVNGPTITLRKQKKDFYSIVELVEMGSLTRELAALLWLGVDGLGVRSANLMISGSVGSGKTTLLNALCMLIPPSERVITIEDTRELNLYARTNYVSLVSHKDVTMDLLLRDTLRMRPDRIVVGEIRHREALTLFNAMNVGNRGMGTIHASSPRDTVNRLMVEPMNVPPRNIGVLDLIVTMHKFVLKGVPVKRVTEVCEVGGVKGETVLLGTVYSWEPGKDRGIGENIRATTYLEHLAQALVMDKAHVMKEMDEKKEVLGYMSRNGIVEPAAVFRVVEEYYKSKKKLDTV